MMPRTWRSSRSISPTPTAPTHWPIATVRAAPTWRSGGLHVTSLPEEAASHADSIFLGTGRGYLPRLPRRLPQWRAAAPLHFRCSARWPDTSHSTRSHQALPLPGPELDRRHARLPASLRFCYKDAFFAGGRGFYTQTVDAALAEIERLPGRHLYFLDDHVLGHQRFARELFCRHARHGSHLAGGGHGRFDPAWRSDRRGRALGLRSLFVGFESLSEANLVAANKRQNLRRDYGQAIRRLHDLGVMINGSFVFGLDDDDRGVFDRTVDWAVDQGLTTATFHILTPYPGTALHGKLSAQQRILHQDWARYDTRQAVYHPKRLTGTQLERGYWRAYRRFYEYRNIFRGARAHDGWKHRAKHLAYAMGWKKCEPLWGAVIHARRLPKVLPLLESVLSEVRRPRHDLPTADRAQAANSGK